jgi:hypothetical protein
MKDFAIRHPNAFRWKATPKAPRPPNQNFERSRRRAELGPGAVIALQNNARAPLLFVMHFDFDMTIAFSISFCGAVKLPFSSFFCLVLC